jgi:hypothetical protein
MGPCTSSAHHTLTPRIEEIPATRAKGFSSVYRKLGVKQLEFAPKPNIFSVFDLYNQSAK